MTTTQPSLFTRPDTFFGVCQGIGEDLGIHPNLFRVSFGMAFFFAPLATLATYFALGLVVAATRFAFPAAQPPPPPRPNPSRWTPRSRSRNSTNCRWRREIRQKRPEMARFLTSLSKR